MRLHHCHWASRRLLVGVRPILFQLELLASPFLYGRDALELSEPPEKISAEGHGHYPHELPAAILELHLGAACVEVFRVLRLPVTDAAPNLRVIGGLRWLLASVPQAVPDALRPGVDFEGELPPDV